MIDAECSILNFTLIDAWIDVLNLVLVDLNLHLHPGTRQHPPVTCTAVLESSYPMRASSLQLIFIISAVPK